jgi:hypothetical protein
MKQNMSNLTGMLLGLAALLPAATLSFFLLFSRLEPGIAVAFSSLVSAAWAGLWLWLLFRCGRKTARLDA